MKKIDLFVILARNRDCGYPLEPPNRGGSNGYPQSMFYGRNKKMYIPANPFLYIKVGFEVGGGGGGGKGCKITYTCFLDGYSDATWLTLFAQTLRPVGSNT